MRSSTARALACLLPIVAVLGLVPAPVASAQDAELVPPVTPPRAQVHFDAMEKPAPPIRPVNPPADVREGRAALSADAGLSIIYDPAFPFPAAAKTAFEYAAAIIGEVTSSPVEIVVRAAWKNLGGGSLLGSAGPSQLWPSQPSLPELTEPNTSYPVALVNALRGSDLCPAASTPAYCEVSGQSVHWDINAEFNSANSNLYFGTDGVPGTKIDFVSVALHELMHGLGYLAGFSRNPDTGVGSYGSSPPGFARRVVNDAGQSLTNTALFPNPSVALGNQLTLGIGKIRWSGSNGVAAAGGTQPILYSPTTFSPGSSVAHLDEGTYPSGNPNALMTPTIGSGQAVHDPGPISRGMLTDLGWTLVGGIPATVPAAPSGVSVVASGTSATVSFTPGSDGGSAVTEYYARCDSSTGGTTRTSFGPASPVVVTALSAGHQYRCRVRAFNAIGASSFSAYSAAFTPVSVPAPPTNLTVAPSGTTVTVSFVPGSDGGSPVTEFYVRCDSTTGGTTRLVYGGSSPLVVTGLSGGHQYRCRARAFNAVGASAFSAYSATFTAKAPPLAPTGVTAIPSGTSVAVSFTPGFDGGSPVTEFYARCDSTTGGATRVVYGPASPLTVTGLTAGHQYRCRVRAFNAAGAGQFSSYTTLLTAG